MAEQTCLCTISSATGEDVGVCPASWPQSVLATRSCSTPPPLGDWYATTTTPAFLIHPHLHTIVTVSHAPAESVRVHPRTPPSPPSSRYIYCRPLLRQRHGQRIDSSIVHPSKCPPKMPTKTLVNHVHIQSLLSDRQSRNCSFNRDV